MHRPTRKHQNMKAKLEQKLAVSRFRGKKARRWQKWIAEYDSLAKSE